MDKLEPTGHNLGRVYNSKLRHSSECHAIAYITEWPNLKLKTRPKQLLGSLPLSFTLPALARIQNGTSRVTFQIVASLLDYHDNRNVFMIKVYCSESFTTQFG